ncbi:MAG: nitronate monooxygenase [Motiliproteus sp.]
MNSIVERAPMQFREFLKKLRLPVIQAPMLRVSGPEMVIAACRAGIIGSFPAPNARTLEILGDWYAQISQVSKAEGVPWAANVIVHPSNPRLEGDLAQVYKHKPPIVITALGSPKEVIDSVHAYGGYVLADVASPRHARKAVDAGADGLVLLCSGAGGYTGSLSPFAFIEEVRGFFDGPVVLAGAINSGRSIRAAQVAGADLAYMGTGFIATDESMAKAEYKEMIVESVADDTWTSDAITGAPVCWLKPSLVKQGLDPKTLVKSAEFDFSKQTEGKRRWTDIWSAGHAVGASTAVVPLACVVDRLETEYRAVLQLERQQLDALATADSDPA